MIDHPETPPQPHSALHELTAPVALLRGLRDYKYRSEPIMEWKGIRHTHHLPNKSPISEKNYTGPYNTSTNTGTLAINPTGSNQLTTSGLEQLPNCKITLPGT
jgi:hypothetical protein